jgi:predicted nucleic acid-binding protein
MKGERPFFDTNILIYAFARDDPRAATARNLLAECGTVGVQVLNEFVAVARGKMAMPWDDVEDALSAVRALCSPPVRLSVETHDRAVRIARQYGYHIYDSLVIAAAQESSCSTLYSEDLRDGQVIDGLTIRNPFRTA